MAAMDAIPSGPCIPRINDPAPDFVARTTLGERALSSYRGRWLLLFSHPADFTPVCTSEFIAFSREYERFQQLDCDILGLSADSLFAHLAWIRSIEKHFDITIPFPIIEDPSMAIAQAYGMITPNAPDSSLMRAVFVIDPAGILRAISWYPITIGRNIDEMVRLVAALQVSDRHEVATPAGWWPGDEVILPPPQTADELRATQGTERDWYFHTKKLDED